jgi:alkylated DNA repair dioxygenase AlkB
MNLFHSSNKSNNLLPFDGEVYYYGVIFTADQAKNYMDKLLRTIEWKNDEAILFGKHITTKRKVAWYGDSRYSYTYSKTTKDALPWTLDLIEIKSYVEKRLQHNFNSCLLNLYHNGKEGMAYHSDDEKSLEKNGIITSLSFGAERKFSFRHKRTKETIHIYLEAGSLLTMGGSTQTNWLHSLPTTQKIRKPRINLTFRNINSV